MSSAALNEEGPLAISFSLGLSSTAQDLMVIFFIEGFFINIQKLGGNNINDNFSSLNAKFYIFV